MLTGVNRSKRLCGNSSLCFFIIEFNIIDRRSNHPRFQWSQRTLRYFLLPCWLVGYFRKAMKVKWIMQKIPGRWVGLRRSRAGKNFKKLTQVKSRWGVVRVIKYFKYIEYYLEYPIYLMFLLSSSFLCLNIRGKIKIEYF